MQETFLKALRGFASFEPGTNFKAWIFRILRNTYLTSRSGLAAMRTVSLEEELEKSEESGHGLPEAAIDRQTPEINLMRLSDRPRSMRDGEAAAAAAGGDPAVRCGRDEVQGDCRGARDSHRHGDVADCAGAWSVASRTAAGSGGATMREHLDVTILNALVSGELSSEERSAASEHLAECASCTAGALSSATLKLAAAQAGMRYVPSPEFAERITGQSMGLHVVSN